MSEAKFSEQYLRPSSNTTPTTASPLSSQDVDALAKLAEHFNRDGLKLSNSDSSSESSPLSEREFMYLSQETFLRFLKATKGDLAAAITRLEAAVVWRRSVNIEDMSLMAEDCEPESRTGKNIVQGFTKSQKPILYFFPNRNTTPVDQRRPVHAVGDVFRGRTQIFMLERARDLMPPGSSNVLVIFNFAGKREGPPTSISVARQVLHILSQHYPETLGICHFQNLPWVVKGFINIMWPFVDPVIKEKVSFGSLEGKELINDGVVDEADLTAEAGGSLDLPYKHQDYWPVMVETCLKRRKEQEEAFRALGPPRAGAEERLWRTLPRAEQHQATELKETPSAHATVDTSHDSDVD